MNVFWMINIGSFTDFLFKAFCIDFKFRKCLFHQKFDAKNIITPIPVAFHFQVGFGQSKNFTRRRFFLCGEGV